MTRQVALATTASCLTAGDTVSWIQGHGYRTAQITDTAVQAGPGTSAVLLWLDGNRNDGSLCDLVLPAGDQVWLAETAETAQVRAEAEAQVEALIEERDLLLIRLGGCDCEGCEDFDFDDRPIEDVAVGGGRL